MASVNSAMSMMLMPTTEKLISPADAIAVPRQMPSTAPTSCQTDRQARRPLMSRGPQQQGCEHARGLSLPLHTPPNPHTYLHVGGFDLEHHAHRQHHHGREGLEHLQQASRPAPSMVSHPSPPRP